MSRFYFHLSNDERVLDEEGLELPSIAAARDAATMCARDILADEIRHGRLPLRETIEVTDAQGEPIFTLCFRDVVQIDSAELPGSPLLREA